MVDDLPFRDFVVIDVLGCDAKVYCAFVLSALHSLAESIAGGARYE